MYVRQAHGGRHAFALCAMFRVAQKVQEVQSQQTGNTIVHLLHLWIMDGAQQRSGLRLGGLFSAACLSAGRTGSVEAQS